MANILKAEINVTAPGAAQTFASVSASAQKTEANIKKLTPQISALGNSIETIRAKILARKDFLLTETDIKKVAIYNQEIKQLERELVRLQAVGTSSMGAIGKGASSAFSGLRSMANILPGIGIAGLIGVFSDFVGGLFGIGEQASETAKKLKELIVPIEDIRSAAAAGAEEELAKVKVLSKAVLDQTKSYSERNNALNQLKDINKSYFGDLTLEADKLGVLRDRVNEYTAAIINQAIIKSFSDEIGKLSLELSKQEKEFNKYGKAVADAKDKLKTQQGDDYFFQSIEVNDATADYNDQAKVVGQLRGQMFELRQEIEQAVNASLNFRPLDDPKIIKKAKEVAFQYDYLKQIFNDLIGIQKTFAASLQTDIKLRIGIITDLNLDTLATNFSGPVQQISSDLQKKVEALTKTNPILIRANAKIELTADEKLLQESLDKINEILQRALTDSLTSFGEGLGEALAGGDIQKAFASFAGVVGGAVKAIGQQLIALGTAALAAKIALKSLFKNPALQIAAGIALVAVGSAMEKLLSGGVKGFAAGGFTGVGGRNDPAGIVHKGEFVIPAIAVNKLGVGFLNSLAFGGGIRGYQSGGAVGAVAGGMSLKLDLRGETITRGQDLITVLSLANKSNGRLT